MRTAFFLPCLLVCLLAWLVSPASGLPVEPSPASSGSRVGDTPLFGGDQEALSRFQQGLDQILARRYEQAQDHFQRESLANPQSPVGPLGLMLSLETEMLENEDFRYDSEFKEAAATARKRLRARLDAPTAEAWDHLMAGAFYGLRGMHALRKKNYVFSVRKGMSAVQHLKRAQRYDRELADIDLGLGAYTYFRARLRNVVPWSGTPDGRERGIEQIERAQQDGILVNDVAQMALIVLLLDERQPRQSITLAQDLLERHPGNVMARMHMARGLTRTVRYSEALETLDEAVALAPEHPLLPYYQGHAFYISGRDLDRAENHLQHFVKRAPSTAWRAAGHERLGRRQTEAAPAWRCRQKLVERPGASPAATGCRKDRPRPDTRADRTYKRPLTTGRAPPRRGCDRPPIVWRGSRPGACVGGRGRELPRVHRAPWQRPRPRRRDGSGEQAHGARGANAEVETAAPPPR